MSSHPTRGEWIEMRTWTVRFSARTSLTPHGVSGLKYTLDVIGQKLLESHPTRGEWIEIHFGNLLIQPCGCLTPHGVSGLKYHLVSGYNKGAVSHPTRGEWIEITAGGGETSWTLVSPHTG